MGPLNVVSQLLNVFAGSGCSYQLWGNSEDEVDGELGLPTIHQEIGTEAFSRVVGAIAYVYQCSETAFPVRLGSKGNVPSMLIRVELNFHTGFLSEGGMGWS